MMHWNSAIALLRWGCRAAWPAALSLSLSAARAQTDSAASVPKDKTAYWRPATAEDYVWRGQRPSGAGSVSLSVFLCDVVVSNTDKTLNGSDTWGDEEPSIAVNPANPNEIVILAFSGFWGATAPLWHSTDGGLSWTKSFTVPQPTGLSISGPEDQAPDYGRNNRLSGVFLGSDSFFNTDVYAGITTDPSSAGAFNWPLVGGVAVPADSFAPGANDQPWLLVNPDPNNPGQDNTYVAYDDFSGSPDMRVAVSYGGNPPSFTTDSLVGFSTGAVNPGQRLAKDPSQGYIYSLFQRNIGLGSGGSKNINYMLNRSTDGGMTWSLNGSSTGIIVANGDSTQPTPKFGTVNALLGGVDHAAVDPVSGDVYYVYGRRDAGTSNNRLAIRRLTANGSGGLNIGPEVFVTGQVQAALPSVAVTTNGVIGVLYDTYDGKSASNIPTFSSHLAVSGDAGATFSDTVLYTFLSSAVDNNDSRQRVLGDYQQLKAFGATFYGVFTANGLQLGRPIANHDPIFFKASPAPPAFTQQPADQTAFQGDPVVFSAAVAGAAPLTFQWRFNGVPLTGETNSTLVLTNVALTQAGQYSVLVSNPYGTVPSSSATLTVVPTVSLPFALNTLGLPAILWVTNGDAGWHGLTNISHDAVAAARSGPIGDGQASTLSTVVTGPGTLTFWWKVSSQTNSDGLSFLMFGSGLTNSAQISGEIDWQFMTVLLPDGPQTVQWTYSKDSAGSAGADAGWVDQVGFVAGPTLPVIQRQPAGLSTFAASPVSFNVAASGTPPLLFQWRFNGTDITGATSSSLGLANPGVNDAGLYSVRVANSYGQTNSATAFLGVVPLIVRGDNSLGQINVSLLTTNAIGLAAGDWHSLILRANGSLLAFGDDYEGQTDLPANLGNVLAIAAGGYHSVAALLDGSIVAWGADDYGQTNVPAGLSNVIALAAGTWHSLALRANGTVVAWGDDSEGQCDVPKDLANVVAIAAGGSHSLALRSNGVVVAWGDNYDASGNFAGQSVVPFGLTNAVALGAGDYHSLAVKADGTVIAWGDDSQGQCDTPPGITNAVAIAGGGAHTVLLKADSTVAAWGNDWNGQCDLAPSTSNVVAIAAGYAHTLLLEANRSNGPQLVHPARNHAQFTLSLQTFAGKNYALEYKTNLAAGGWVPATVLRGSGGLQFLTDPLATNRARFYRVREY